MTELSDALKSTLCDLLGSGISNVAWEQATLPVRQGGLGIKDPLQVWPAARLAALANFHARGSYVAVPTDILNYLPPDIGPTLTAMAAQTGTQHDTLNIWLADPSQIKTADRQATRQQWWGTHAAAIRVQRLRTIGTARDQVRIQSQEGPLASAWLTVTPSKANNTTLSDTDF